MCLKSFCRMASRELEEAEEDRERDILRLHRDTIAMYLAKQNVADAQAYTIRYNTLHGGDCARDKPELEVKVQEFRAHDKMK